VRNAASVLPDPVGAAISVFSALRIACHAFELRFGRRKHMTRAVLDLR
jgi:hypothetical protein